MKTSSDASEGYALLSGTPHRSDSISACWSFLKVSTRGSIFPDAEKKEFLLPGLFTSVKVYFEDARTAFKLKLHERGRAVGYRVQIIRSDSRVDICKFRHEDGSNIPFASPVDASGVSLHDCAICLEKYRDHQWVRTTGVCSHWFHADCMESLVDAGIKVCPVRREPLQP